MRLIGMLDSPYVRRTAISLCLLGLPFEHRPKYGPGSGPFLPLRPGPRR